MPDTTKANRILIQFQNFVQTNNLWKKDKFTKTGYMYAQIYLSGLINGAEASAAEIPFIWINYSCGRLDRLIGVTINKAESLTTDPVSTIL